MQKNRVCATATGLPKFTRRSFVAAAAATPLAALPVSATTRPHDHQQEIDNLVAIADHTGLSMDDLADWFRGLHSDVTTQIANNAIDARVRVWEKRQTFSAVLGFKAGEVFQSDPNPLASYCERQIRLRGDREEVKRVLSFYSKSAENFPTLMDMA